MIKERRIAVAMSPHVLTEVSDYHTEGMTWRNLVPSPFGTLYWRLLVQNPGIGKKFFSSKINCLTP